ncbi:MAG: SCO family protein [Ketobacter sp.]
MENETVQQIRTKNRRTLLIALALFVIPVIVAAVLLKTGLYKSVGTSNKGLLINPPLSFEDIPLKDAANKVLDPEQFKRKWWLVYVIPEHCDESCSNSLFQMRQVHTALGPEQSRVERLVISTAPLEAPYDRLIKEEFPKLRVVFTQASQLKQAFAPVEDNQLKATPSGHIYLVDTMGAVFMYYPTYQDEQESILKGRGLLKDLKKVLKLSKIG